MVKAIITMECLLLQVQPIIKAGTQTLTSLSKPSRRKILQVLKVHMLFPMSMLLKGDSYTRKMATIV